MNTVPTHAPRASACRQSRRGRFIALAALALLAGGCDSPTVETQRLSGEGFVLDYPAHLSHSADAPMEDFELHHFDAPTGNLVNLYVGNHADYPSEEFRDLPEAKSSARGLAIRSVSRVHDDGARDRDVLVQLPESRDWPQVLHFWYRGLDAAHAQTADAIIDSAQESTPPQ